tara:strand:+ start:17692 stop:18294 length:603 start_codon:yes stop_codon:yes gene_type:complete
MSWKFSVKNRLKTAGVLLLLCVLLLLANVRNHFISSRVSESIETIYEDRLKAQDLIFSYGHILENVELVLECGSVQERQINQRFAKIDALHERYAKTKLTEEESEVYSSFLQKVKEIQAATNDYQEIEKALFSAKEYLTRLEAIQMEEAQKEMVSIAQLEGNRQISFYLESGILVVLLLIVQVIVLSSGIKQSSSKEVGL